MDIKIGNDVKLNLAVVDEAGQPLNIMSAQAYIMNHSAKEEAINEQRRIDQFISRFPIGRDAIDPKLNGIEPDTHNIHMLGEVPYNCYPRMHYNNKPCGFGVYPKWDKKYIPVIEEYALTSYHAPIMFTDQLGVVSVVYPAEAQYMTGDYDVAIVARVYQSGYRPDNTRTVTIVYTKQFTLIPNESQPSPSPTPGTWTFGGTFPITLS